MRRTRPASGRRAGLTGLQVKVWFVDRKGRAFFGEGIARLLEAIETYKSISLASKQIGMSYRYALHRISTAEERCGIDLVERFRGGGAKGGSRLTEQARNLLRKYNTAREMLRDLAESM
jgi:molybdate transport system regulatory protein